MAISNQIAAELKRIGVQYAPKNDISTLAGRNQSSRTMQGGVTITGAISSLVDAGIPYAEAKALVEDNQKPAYRITQGGVTSTGPMEISQDTMKDLLAQAKSNQIQAEKAQAAKNAAEEAKWKARLDESRTTTIAAVDTQAAAAQSELDWAGKFAQSTLDFWTDYDTEVTPFLNTMKSSLLSELNVRQEMVQNIQNALGTGTGDNAAAQAIRDTKSRIEAEKGQRGREITRLGIDPTSGRYRGAMDEMTSTGIATQAMAANQARGAEKDRYLTHAKDYLGQLTGQTQTNAMTAVNNVYLDKAKQEADMMSKVGQAYSSAGASLGNVSTQRAGIQSQDAEMAGAYKGIIQATPAYVYSGTPGITIT